MSKLGNEKQQQELMSSLWNGDEWGPEKVLQVYDPDTGMNAVFHVFCETMLDTIFGFLLEDVPAQTVIESGSIKCTTVCLC